MPPKKTPSTEADAPTHGYTDGEIQLAFAMIKRLPRPTAYDADAIAAEIGSASGSSVRKRVSLAMGKHGWFSGVAPTTAEGAENGSPAVTPKTPRAKKTPTTSGRKKKLQDTEDGDDEQEQDTPAKKKPRGNARKVKSEQAVEQAVDDADSCAKTEEALKTSKAEEEGAASEERQI
ncbi:hypothetical protein CPLU01_14168 [Colletotrichum plurivorum]|uniref:Uncharacterized protein n=1 Tax=Colletotrichum plurivorum TaxID=2175906 RepID=A0A8H6JLT5_9PEZI|nr:hypothetical protein CPLU01_14168 [Colletotrichum plurivorum]